MGVIYTGVQKVANLGDGNIYRCMEIGQYGNINRCTEGG